MLRNNAEVEDGARATTSGQKTSLTLVTFGTYALAVYDKVSFSRPKYSRWGYGLRYVVRGENERKFAPSFIMSHLEHLDNVRGNKQ